MNNCLGILCAAIMVALLATADLAADVVPSGEDAIDESGPNVSDVLNRDDSALTLDSFYNLYQPYLSNISAYKPIYFLIGVDPEESKFQFSFKYQFLNQNSPVAQKHPRLTCVYFAYTQSSFWDLASDSLPFDDSSYQPELFYLSTNIKTRPSWASGMFFKMGLKHESNGKAEQDSRDVNTLYVKPTAILYNERSGYGLSVAPTVRGYLSTGDENPDIEDYRGYVELDLRFGKADSIVVMSLLRWAKEGGSGHIDLTWPLGKAISDNFSAYMHVQYANVLAENLLNYRERTEAIRVGLSFVR